jgi:hypothetical protein
MWSASISFVVFAAFLFYVSRIYREKSSTEFGFDPPQFDTVCLKSRGIDPDIFDGFLACIESHDIGGRDCSSVQGKNDEIARDFVNSVIRRANKMESKREYFLSGLLDNSCARVAHETYANFTFIMAHCLIHEKNSNTTVRVILSGLFDTKTHEEILLDIDTNVCTF